MTHFEQQPEPATLEEVCEQFEQWRQTREKRGMIPDQLWEAAIALSTYHSAYKISQSLRLNYSDFKKRVERSKHLPDKIKPKFIGFEIGNRESAEYIIEMAHPNGAAMKAHIKGSNIDFNELSKIFWSTGK
jgi:hypothetical protein